MRNDSLNDKLVDVCAELGVEFRNVPGDGEWHRVDLENDPKGREDGSIKIFADGQGAIVKNWKTGEHKTVQVRDPGSRRVDGASIRNSEKNLQVRNQSASERARKIWDASVPAPDDHGYLLKKRVGANGTRVYKGMLVIPVVCDGRMVSLQFIGIDGKKSFLKGGRVAAGHYFIGAI